MATQHLSGAMSEPLSCAWLRAIGATRSPPPPRRSITQSAQVAPCRKSATQQVPSPALGPAPTPQTPLLRTPTLPALRQA
eukprot:3599911-Prymnesium_polylepis.1